jgi:glycosyltransferase involved in cell wall biosynthesis
MVAACPFPAPRGTPIRVLRLAEELAARGHRVHVVTYHYGYGSGAVDPRLSVHRTPALSYRRHSPGPSWPKLVLLDPLLAATLFAFLRRERVDVIHAHHYEGLLAAAVARASRRIPLVFDAHTLLASELPSYRLGLPRAAARFLGAQGDRRLPGLADHVASCSERIRSRLIELDAIPADRVTLVPNGVEPGLFDAPAYPPRAAGAAPTLVFTGNLAGYQGIGFMLAALRKVLDRRSDVRLTVVTNAPFDDYEAEARELGVRGAIDLVPAPIEEVPNLLAGSDVALNPRVECDGIPVKLLNYMAAGRAVVSFAGSAPGLSHGATAWLARDGDVDDFADGVLALLADPPLAEALGRNARRFVEANHSWTRAGDLMEQVYGRLLAGDT